MYTVTVHYINFEIWVKNGKIYRVYDKHRMMSYLYRV